MKLCRVYRHQHGCDFISTIPTTRTGRRQTWPAREPCDPGSAPGCSISTCGPRSPTTMSLYPV